jgi:hypothetical protein
MIFMAETGSSESTILARGIARLRRHVGFHRDFVLILALATAFRLMAALVFRPGGFVGDISTFGYYRLLLSFTAQGYAPLVDFWLEYPPLFPWIMTGIYRLSLLIPPWTEPGAWFFVLLTLFFTFVEAGNLTLLYAIGRRLYGRDRAVRLTWIYVALLVPVLTLFMAFDSLALLFLLWTVLLALDRRAIPAGIVTGLGFMTKLVPVVAAPAALQHLPGWSRRAKYLVAAALVVLLVVLPFLLAGPEHLIQALLSPARRASWETVWALIDGYYSFGVAGGPDRFDPAQAGAAQHPSSLPSILLTVGFGLLFLALYTRRIDWQDRRRVVAFVALTQNLLLIYAQGYSPQFLVLLLPFLILLIPGWRGIAYALLLSAVNLVEFPIYFLVLPGEPWLLAGTVLLRTLILIVTAAEYAAQVYDWPVPGRWWRRIAAGTLALVVVLGLVGGWFGFQAYRQARYEASAHRPAIETLKARAAPGATLVTDDLVAYEGLYPFVHSDLDLRLIETFDYLPPWQPRLAEAVAGAGGPLWLYTRTDSPLYDWLLVHRPRLDSYQFDGWQLSAWDTQ